MEHITLNTEPDGIALPRPEDQPTVDLWPTAATALGLGRSAVYNAAARGDLPVTVLHCGRKLRVATAELRRVLALDA
jgi:hypothetical protein